MSPRHADTFTILQHAHILPIGFLIAKRRPTVFLRFEQEFLHGPTHGCREEECARDRVIKIDGFRAARFFDAF